ncbi:MAG: hypothetical protein CMN95_00165 [Synechococcus sp. MED650]|nr:hypothetical protein [Synechococcus sp. MED650]OUW57927.1 MAG: hypothetical protein CBD48_00050 [Cyanobacteria bacterium TMED188]
MCTCTVCGGSGIQRVNSQRFRTCIVCLGTGQISSALQSAPLNHQPINTQGLANLTCQTRRVT